MREITKMVEFKVDETDMSFRITKMNAFDGAYLMKIVTEKAMPLLQEAINYNGDKDDDSLNVKLVTDLLPRLLNSMDEEDLRKLMVLCLRTVEVSLPIGYQKVVDAKGNFGIAELQYDTASCLRLVYEVIAYNCSGFFDGSGLSSLLASKIGSRPAQ